MKEPLKTTALLLCSENSSLSFRSVESGSVSSWIILAYSAKKWALTEWLYVPHFHFRNNSTCLFNKASAFNVSVTVFHCGFQQRMGGGEHLLNKVVTTTSLINDNRALWRGSRGGGPLLLCCFPWETVQEGGAPMWGWQSFDNAPVEDQRWITENLLLPSHCTGSFEHTQKESHPELKGHGLVIRHWHQLEAVHCLFHLTSVIHEY